MVHLIIIFNLFEWENVTERAPILIRVVCKYSNNSNFQKLIPRKLKLRLQQVLVEFESNILFRSIKLILDATKTLQNIESII